MVDWIVQNVLGAPPWLVYLIVWLVVFAEDALFVGFVIPGETVAIVGGVTATLGHTSLVAVFAVVITAAIIGDSVGFEVGRAFGPRILGHRWLANRRGQLDGAQEFLRRRGAIAVFLGRWTAFFRAVMPFLAGSSRMPYPTFILWNAIGGITWGATVVTIGFVAGRSYQRIETWLGRGTAVVITVIVLAAVTVWQVRRRREAATDPRR